MAIGRTNAGGGFTKSVIIVTAPTGSTVTCTKGTTVKTATEKNGEWWFKNLDIGTWTLKATLSGQTETQTVNITQFGVYRVAMTYRVTPEFTYTGNYKVVQDNDSEISDFANWKGNWKIRFLTSGTFTVKNMYGWNGHINVFVVGSGAGGSVFKQGSYGQGGGGGYTKTGDIFVSPQEGYSIVIGAGGEADMDGNSSSAFSIIASGGKKGTDSGGGDGGSGAAGGGEYPGEPGTDGRDGTVGSGHYPNPGGKGQISTPGPNGETGSTREFGTGSLYCSGGKSNANPTTNAGDNTGDGGPGGKGADRKGGSGIVVIRNAR